MTDLKPVDQTKRRFSAGCFLAFGLLLVVYVLSPPFAVFLMGDNFSREVRRAEMRHDYQSVSRIGLLSQPSRSC